MIGAGLLATELALRLPQLELCDLHLRNEIHEGKAATVITRPLVSGAVAAALTCSPAVLCQSVRSVRNTRAPCH